MNDSFSNPSIVKKGINSELHTKDLIKISSKSFECVKFKLHLKTCVNEIRQVIKSGLIFAQDKGCSPSIETALIEAVKNAFDHGSKKDESKNIIFGYRFENKGVEFIICDQGKVLADGFVKFVLEQRSKDSSKNFMDWYKFSGSKPGVGADNLGKGTSFIHAYIDEVGYFCSNELGGLAVLLRKNL
jgi:hypothetical protein